MDGATISPGAIRATASTPLARNARARYQISVPLAELRASIANSRSVAAIPNRRARRPARRRRALQTNLPLAPVPQSRNVLRRQQRLQVRHQDQQQRARRYRHPALQNPGQQPSPGPRQLYIRQRPQVIKPRRVVQQAQIVTGKQHCRRSRQNANRDGRPAAPPRPAHCVQPNRQTHDQRVESNVQRQSRKVYPAPTTPRRAV